MDSVPDSGARRFFAGTAFQRLIADFPKGATIYQQGAPADAIHYLEAGSVLLTVASAAGRNAVVDLLEPGDFFGDCCLHDPPVRRETARTMTDARVIRLARSDAVSMMKDRSEFCQILVRHLLRRTRRLEEDVVDQKFHSTEQRLARLLLRLATGGTGLDTKTIPLPLSQETLAEIVGTTRPRISYFLNKFRRLGLIAYNGKLEVHRSLLRALLDDA